MLLLDEPFGALDAKVRAELREWLRRLHDEVHVTTVLVTHDQEEAMASRTTSRSWTTGGSSRSAARASSTTGRRTGSSWASSARSARSASSLVRPHDIAISLAPEEGARQAKVSRVVHLGFEVRVELALDGDGTVSAQITRHEAEQLELVEGGVVWVRTTGRAAVPA